MIDFSIEENFKKFGLDQMRDQNGNPMSREDAIALMQKRQAHAPEVAKELFEILNRPE
jgi:hypothetical protein